jgi:hypothetical protein
MLLSATIVGRMNGGGTIVDGMTLLLETQAQRRIAGRTWLSPGLITTQPGGDLLAPGRRVVKHRLISMAGRRVFGWWKQARRIHFPGFRPGMGRDSSMRCGIRGRRAAADVTTKRTRHESQSYEKARNQSRRITMSDNHEESAGIQSFGRLCLPRRSRAKFTTTADDLVPAILAPAISLR